MRERRPQEPWQRCHAVLADRRLEHRGVIVLIGGNGHAKADRSRIDASAVQVPHVAQHRGAERTVEAGWIARRGEQLETRVVIVPRIEAVGRSVVEQRQRRACIRRRLP